VAVFEPFGANFGYFLFGQARLDPFFGLTVLICILSKVRSPSMYMYAR